MQQIPPLYSRHRDPSSNVPRSLTKKNRLQILPTDPDEPEYKGVTALKLTVVGQTEMFIKFKTIRNI